MLQISLLYPSLQVLYIHYNKLKKLPETLANLKKLESLDISHNNLKELPNGLGQLARVRTFNLSGNPKLVRLNKQVANMRSVEKMVIDTANMVYPSSAVCKEGTEAVMKFLCKGEWNYCQEFSKLVRIPQRSNSLFSFSHLSVKQWDAGGLISS